MLAEIDVCLTTLWFLAARICAWCGFAQVPVQVQVHVHVHGQCAREYESLARLGSGICFGVSAHCNAMFVMVHITRLVFPTSPLVLPNTVACASARCWLQGNR